MMRSIKIASKRTRVSLMAAAIAGVTSFLPATPACGYYIPQELSGVAPALVVASTGMPGTGSSQLDLRFFVGAFIGAMISALVFSGVERAIKRVEKTYNRPEDPAKPLIAVGTVVFEHRDNDNPDGPLVSGPCLATLVATPAESGVYSTLSLGRESFYLIWTSRNGLLGKAEMRCISGGNPRGEVEFDNPDDANAMVRMKLTPKGGLTRVTLLMFQR